MLNIIKLTDLLHRYPWNMMDSRESFWLAAIYEVTLIFHTVVIISSFDFLHVHFMITASMRFDALSHYFSKSLPRDSQTDWSFPTSQKPGILKHARIIYKKNRTSEVCHESVCRRGKFLNSTHILWL